MALWRTDSGGQGRRQEGGRKAAQRLTSQVAGVAPVQVVRSMVAFLIHCSQELKIMTLKEFLS